MSKICISKKKLLSLLKSNLQEMSMNFSTEDRPDPGIQDALSSQKTPHKNVPYPTDVENPYENFQELLASERYKKVVENLRRYTGNNRSYSDINSLSPLVSVSMNVYSEILEIERNHKRELEQLAIEIVEKEMGIPNGTFQYDVKLITPQEIDIDNFNMKPDDSDEEVEDEIEREEKLLDLFDELSLEKAKRRFINAMIQGSSETGHYMYHLVSQRLQEITRNNRIIPLYGIAISLNDFFYWQFPDQILKQQSQGGDKAGAEEVDRNTDPPTIKAQGVMFPVLVHEIIKGIMELISIQGMPEDEETQREVQESEDTLEKEIWDIRLGPAIWQRIRDKFPQEVFENDNRWIQNYILMEVFRLPAKEFFVFMIKVLQNKEEGELLMSQLVEGIRQKLQRIETSHLYNDDEDSDEQDYDDEEDSVTNNEETPSSFRETLKKSTDEMSNDELNAYIDEMLKKKQQGNL